MLSPLMTFVITADSFVLPNAPQTFEQKATESLDRTPVRQ
jgi:hypothetical protein